MLRTILILSFTAISFAGISQENNLVGKWKHFHKPTKASTYKHAAAGTQVFIFGKKNEGKIKLKILQAKLNSYSKEHVYTKCNVTIPIQYKIEADKLILTRKEAKCKCSDYITMGVWLRSKSLEPLILKNLPEIIKDEYSLTIINNETIKIGDEEYSKK